ncbi:hypothetical protein J3R82DRAFT_7878 [Butyriboletus roseoflavus]|nr:hypothetical protein J3R82DRAFT_7878 [Butyriboletus roseoflavus]
MRFSSSLVAFAYLGFAAALVLPVIPKPTTTISTTALPERTPDFGARDGVKLPSTGSISPAALPTTSAPTLPGGDGGKGDKKGDTIARRDESVPGVGDDFGPSLPIPSSSLPTSSLSTGLPIPTPSVPA